MPSSELTPAGQLAKPPPRRSAICMEIPCQRERPSRSKSPSPQPSPGVPGEGARRRGFTLLEMLTTVAALVILLGLMVDLARYVRNDSSVKLTKQLLYQCDLLLAAIPTGTS